MRTRPAPRDSRPGRSGGTSACPTNRIGTPTMQGSAATGLTQTAAPTTSSAVTHAIDVSGMANRIVRASASTSAVVRETRSPIPARSTVESGSARTRRMKSSRSSANIRSERTNEARRAKNVRIVCATRKPARISDDPVDLGRVDPRLDRPGRASRAAAARRGRSRPREACRTRTPISARRCRPASAVAWRRISAGPRSGGACSCRLSAGDDVAVGGARARAAPDGSPSPERARRR